MSLHKQTLRFEATGGTDSEEDWSLSGANDGTGVNPGAGNRLAGVRSPFRVLRIDIVDDDVAAASPTLAVEDEAGNALCADPGTEVFYETGLLGGDGSEYRGVLVAGPLVFIGDDLAEGDVAEFVVFIER